jgi:hypothetical protein
MKIKHQTQLLTVKLTFNQVALCYLLLTEISGRHRWVEVDNAMVDEMREVLHDCSLLIYDNVVCNVYINTRKKLDYDSQVLENCCKAYFNKHTDIKKNQTFSINAPVKQWALILFLLANITHDQLSHTVLTKLCKSFNLNATDVSDELCNNVIEIKSGLTGIQFDENVFEYWISKFTLYPYEQLIRFKEQHIESLSSEIAHIRKLARTNKTKELEQLLKNYNTDHE